MRTIRRTSSSRNAASLALLVLAVVLALAGGVAFYAREEIVDSKAFAAHAQDALERDAVRRVVVREVVVQLIERGSADLISARPALEAVVEVVVRTRPFLHLFRAAAEHANRLLFVREGSNAAFAVSDVGTVVANALRGVLPSVAGDIPRDVGARLIELRRRSFAARTLRIADDVRVLGIAVPVLALLALGLAVALAPDRRRALTRAGVAVGVGAATLAIALLVARAYVVGNVHGSDELTDAEVRAAIGGLWDAFLGGLTVWALAVGALSLVTAAASASVLRPYAGGSGLVRLRELLRPPARPAGRGVHGAALMALGVFVVLQPTLALRIAAVITGALTVYYGAGELLSVTYSPRVGPGTATRRGRRRRGPIALAAGAGAVALGVVLIIAIGGGRPGRASRAGPVQTCNGYAELCSRRLEQVVFAGTHNSMSAADVHGWALANQRRDIARQLQDGIRLFLLDPHYGVRQPNGLVRTDFTAERRGLNKVAESLSPAAVQALQRIGARLGKGSVGSGTREVWLCHTVCELGATRMRSALVTIRRFIQRNPDAVVIIFDEDYVSERDLDRVYRAAGLAPYLATLDRLQPLPTLGELVHTGKRVIVLSERQPSGQYPWNGDGSDWVQDTPFDAKTPRELGCARERGTADSPLLMLNQFLEHFPPSPSAAGDIQTERAIISRARRCRRERGLRPNLIAADFYDRGDLIGAVRRLNGLGNRRPAPTR